MALWIVATNNGRPLLVAIIANAVSKGAQIGPFHVETATFYMSQMRCNGCLYELCYDLVEPIRVKWR